MKTPIFLSFLEKLFLLNPSNLSLHLPFIFSNYSIVDLINKIKFNSLHALKLLLQDKNEEEGWRVREDKETEEGRESKGEDGGGRPEEEGWREEEEERMRKGEERRKKEKNRGNGEEEGMKEKRGRETMGIKEEMLVEVGKRIVRGIVGQLKMLFGEEKCGRSFDSLMEMNSVREVVNEATDFLGEAAGDYRFFACFFDNEIRFTYVNNKKIKSYKYQKTAGFLYKKLKI